MTATAETLTPAQIAQYLRNPMFATRETLDDVHIERWNLGYHHCKHCGDALARQRKWTVAIPYSKGAYQLVYDPKDLFNTNPKEQRA